MDVITFKWISKKKNLIRILPAIILKKLAISK